MFCLNSWNLTVLKCSLILSLSRADLTRVNFSQRYSACSASSYWAPSAFSSCSSSDILAFCTASVSSAAIVAVIVASSALKSAIRASMLSVLGASHSRFFSSPIAAVICLYSSVVSKGGSLLASTPFLYSSRLLLSLAIISLLFATAASRLATICCSAASISLDAFALPSAIKPFIASVSATRRLLLRSLKSDLRSRTLLSGRACPHLSQTAEVSSNCSRSTSAYSTCFSL